MDRHPALASTNDTARAAAEAGAAEGLLVQADLQTAGRGRLGHGWVSPAGNLYMSLLLRPEVSASRAASLSFVAALAVSDMVMTAVGAGGPVTCKWPNDVLVGGAKIAGILLESRAAGEGRVAWVIVGIGVNVAHCPDGLPYAATSLVAQGAAGRVDAARDVLADRFAVWYERWRREGFAPIRQAWLERADGLGQRIGVRLPTEQLRGRFTGLDPAGCLLLDLDDGTRRTIAAGEIFRSD